MTRRSSRFVLFLSIGLISGAVAHSAYGDDRLLPTDAAANPANPTSSAARANTAAGDAVKAAQSVERALIFLTEDSARWRKARGCATCHHGILTTWVLSEASQRGYTVSAETLADTIHWTKDLFVPQFSKPRDLRWGYHFVGLPGIYLATMSQTLPILSRDELDRVALHLAAHAEEDGAWELPPPKGNGAPPTWESRETIALWALLAWGPITPAEPRAASANRAARERVLVWLADVKPSETNQALWLRLLVDLRAGLPPERIRPQIAQLLKRQNPDGGWSQVPEMPSDAYATGQVLWALSFAGIKPQDPQIQRGEAYLVTSQREDGSWPITQRHHTDAEEKKDRNPQPIIYFASGWATLGLVRWVPPALDVATRQQKTFEFLKLFRGTYEVDEQREGKPVVSVRVIYEVDDDQVATLADLLTAFPQLEAVAFKSAYMTDASAARLKALPQLRRLTLEDTQLTDAGLSELKALRSLEELNVQGTKVTDVGIADIQKALPKVKVQR